MLLGVARRDLTAVLATRSIYMRWRHSRDSTYGLTQMDPLTYWLHCHWAESDLIGDFLNLHTTKL